MSSGLAVDRQLIIVLPDGTPLVDWGDGLGVDLYRGEFIRYETGVQHYAIQDAELEILKQAGSVVSYDQLHVFLTSLPEPPRPASG